MPQVEGPVEVAGSVDEPAASTVDAASSYAEPPAQVSTPSGPPSSTTTMETVVIGDGTFGIKVDEVIVDEITEAV
jgi:hypothetical protein